MVISVLILSKCHFTLIFVNLVDDNALNFCVDSMIHFVFTGPGSSFIVKADDAMEGEVDAEDDDEATVEDDSGPEEGDQAVRETEQVFKKSTEFYSTLLNLNSFTLAQIVK